MKRISSNKYLFTPILLLIFFSCAGEDSTEPTEDNLVYETSFEENGLFFTDDWSLSALSSSSNSTPPGGGSFSLAIEASDPPQIYSSIKVVAKTQYTINRLTFWSKASGVTSGVYGTAVLSLIRNGAELRSKSIQIDQINWQSFSIQDTFTVAAGDSFQIKFSGGMNQLLSGRSYFDLVHLQGIK